MRDAAIINWVQYKDAQERYSRDMSAPATQRGTTVATDGISASTVSGTHKGKSLTTNGVTIDNESTDTATGIWYGRIKGTVEGLIMIKLTITFADGDIVYRYFLVDNQDPETS